MRRRRTAEPQPGIPARFATICSRCGGDVIQGDRVVYARGRLIHARCAGGQDES